MHLYVVKRAGKQAAVLKNLLGIEEDHQKDHASPVSWLLQKFPRHSPTSNALSRFMRTLASALPAQQCFQLRANFAVPMPFTPRNCAKVRRQQAIQRPKSAAISLCQRHNIFSGVPVLQKRQQPPRR